MKKTTKILLVLAAVVAMAIGAVSTVMAADDAVVIGAWSGNDTDGWSAKDTAGNTITRGFAKSEAGIWYYFQSGKMVKNTFVTYQGKIYFLGGDGAMCTNWVQFKGDTAVTFNWAEYADVAAAFGVTELGTDDIVPFTAKTVYATLWCYFNEDGTMVTDSWVQDSGLWYYMDGPFCLYDEYCITLKIANGSTKTANFGFGKNGNMHVGWIPVYTTEDTSKGQGPYAEGGKSEKVADWIYYDNSGAQAVQGWKKIGTDWYYFKDNDDYGTILLTNVLLTENTYTFYFDKNGVMQTGEVTFGSASSATTIEALKLNGSDIEDDDSKDISLAKKAYATLLFKSNGIQQTGIQNNAYYATNASNLAVVEKANINSVAKEVTVTAKANPAVEGAKVSGNFFVCDGTTIYYFENGYLVKNDTVSFGTVTLAFDSNGKLIQKKDKDYATVGGVKYYFDATYGTVTFETVDSNADEAEIQALVVNGASTTK